MAGSPRKRAKKLALEGVIASLKREHPVDTLGIEAADDANTMYACDVLFNHHGDVRAALVELGYPVEKSPPEEVKNLGLTVFDQAVIRRMNHRLGDLELQKMALFARQVQIAKSGSAEESTRAFQMIARVAGWIAPLRVDLQSKSAVVNIHTIMQDPELIAQALEQLGHEPGEAIAANSEARERFERTLREKQPALEGELVGDGRHQ